MTGRVGVHQAVVGVRLEVQQGGAGNDCASDSAIATPDSPGPPGLITSEPIFAPVAGNLITKIEARAPSGLA